jgi:hypothetical protein
LSCQRDLETRCHQLEQELRLAFDLKTQQERHFALEKSSMEKHNEKERALLERQHASQQASLDACRHDVLLMQQEKKALERQLEIETAALEGLRHEKEEQQIASIREQGAQMKALESERKALAACCVQLAQLRDICNEMQSLMLESQTVGDDFAICVDDLKISLHATQDAQMCQEQMSQQKLAEALSQCTRLSGGLVRN